MKKYIVYITHYTGTKLPKWYIGSSYEEKVINGYNGSVKSKKYKEIYDLEQKENKHLFTTKILSYHETSKESLTEELRLQKKHLVVKNDKYFNESYASVNGYFGYDNSGKNSGSYGKVTVKNSKNEIFHVSNKDGRYLSGELVSVVKDTVHAKNIFTGLSVVIDNNTFYSNKKYVGVRSKHFWIDKDKKIFRKMDLIKVGIHNPQSKKWGLSKIALEEAKQYIKE